MHAILFSFVRMWYRALCMASRRHKGASVRFLRWASQVWTGVLLVMMLLVGLLLGLRFVLPLFSTLR